MCQTPSSVVLGILVAMAGFLGTVATQGANTASVELSEALECSACSVVAELAYNASANEQSRMTPSDCDSLKERYVVRQEAYGAHLKVFVPTWRKIDMVTIEAAEFYDDDEHEDAFYAMDGLVRYCKHKLAAVPSETFAVPRSTSPGNAFLPLRDFQVQLCRYVSDGDASSAVTGISAACTPEKLKGVRLREIGRRREWRKKPIEHKRKEMSTRSKVPTRPLDDL